MESHLDPRLRSSLRTTSASHLPSLPLTSLSDNSVRLPLPTRSHFSLLSDASQQQHSSLSQLQPHPQQHHPYYHLPPAPVSSVRAPLLDHNGDGTNDPKRPRACEACRGLKVRCEAEPTNPDGPCKRCTKARRNCVVTAPTRKRQKKTDSRVAELEKKIDALTASLQATKSEGASGRDSLDGKYTNSEDDVSHPGDDTLEGEHFQPDDALPFAGGDARPSSWIGGGGSDTRTQSPPQSLLARTSPPTAGPPGVKRKHSELSPDAAIQGPLPPISAERSQPTGGNPQSVYPFLIPKTLRDEHPSGPRSGPAPSSSTVLNGPRYEHADVIDRQVLSAELATQFFDRYINEMAPLFPAVVFSPGTTAAEVRKTKPTLFLAILSIGAGASHPALQESLTKEITKVLAERIICNGEKSMELIHALHVVTIWYTPPKSFEELKFYQLIHIAAVMAIDLGLGRRMRHSKLALGGPREHHMRRGPLIKLESAEARRAWVTCFFLSANASMALRRPSLIRWTSYTADCVEFLESSPEALPSDRNLCHWARVQHLSEQIGLRLGTDDPPEVPNLPRSTVQEALKDFNEQLQAWRAQLPKDGDNRILEMGGHAVDLYVHDMTIWVQAVPEESQPQITDQSVEGPREASEMLGAAEISTLQACLSATHSFIGLFLGLSVETVRALPIFHFVRVANAAVSLTKLYFSAIAPNSELGKVMTRNDLKAEENLDGLREIFEKAAEGDRCKSASKFLMVLVMLKHWFQKQRGGHPKCGPLGKLGTFFDGQLPMTGIAGKCPIPKNESDVQRECEKGPDAIKVEDGARHEQTRKKRPTGAKEGHTGASPSDGAVAESNYDPANTPLQLLSEVAMGKSTGMADMNGAPNSHGHQIGNDGQVPVAAGNWYSVGPQDSGAIDPSLQYPAGNAAPYLGGVQQPVSSYGLVSDAELAAAVGTGFDQAMLTLGSGDFSSIFLDDIFFGRGLDAFQNNYENWG